MNLFKDRIFFINLLFLFMMFTKEEEKSRKKKCNQSKVRRQFDNVRPRSWLVKLSVVIFNFDVELKLNFRQKVFC